MKLLAERLRIAVSWIGIGLLVLIAIGSESIWQSSELAEECFNSVAFLLTATGCLGRVWCLTHIAGKKNKELVTLGPYSLCRNPLYLFSLLGAIGVGMATCTFTLPLVILIGFASLYPAVIAAEEARLALAHGDSYQDYCRQTPRFFPSFRLYKPAGQLAVDIRRFQAGLLDAAWFLLAILGAHLIAELHENGYAPAVFRLV